MQATTGLSYGRSLRGLLWGVREASTGEGVVDWAHSAVGCAVRLVFEHRDVSMVRATLTIGWVSAEGGVRGCRRVAALVVRS